jgi:MFS transporter, ACS family, tartrate transporter
MADARDMSSAVADLPSESDFGQSTLRKIAWRLLPLFALGYGVAIMDRTSTKHSWWLIAAFAVAITGLYATQGIIYAIPGSFLKGKSAATGIAVVTSMGILGGFAGPAWIGWMREATGSFQIGLMSLAIPCITGAVIAVSLKIPAHDGSGRS